MAIIPNIFDPVQPDIFTRVRTRERVNAVSGGSRVLAIVGEGETEEDLVVSANGGGADGWNSDFSGTNSPDGRHFKISKIGLIANRTSILKNGIPLAVIEGSITSTAFDNRYDARVDPLTGRVELQRAHLVDFGSDANGNTLYYSASTSNTGTGTVAISQTSLLDVNAPAETWTARVVGVVKDSLGDIIPGEATITVTGSESGQVIDLNGNAIVWKSGGVVTSNGILNIAFTEGGTPFNVGDRFTMQTDSGVLSANDELSARYIAASDLNTAESFFSPSDAFAVYGQPSATNTLSLGMQMAFENGAPLVTAVMAKPPVPRKTDEYLITADNLLTGTVEGAAGTSLQKDTIFPLSMNALPDIDSKINIFVVNTDGTEKQLLLNKKDFYDTALTSVALGYSSFVSGPLTESYTVFTSPEVEQSSIDGYVQINSGSEIYFSSPTVQFSADRLATGEGDVGKELVILSPTEVAGTYTLNSVGDGYGNLNVALATGSPSGSPGDIFDGYVSWQIVDPNDTDHAYFAITDDVAISSLTAGKGLRISYVDTLDADFFDTNWSEASQALELVDVQLVCPLPMQTVSSIQQVFKTHVETESNILNQHERILLTGALLGLTADNVIGNTLAAVENVGVLEGIQGDDAEEVLQGNIEDLANYSVPAGFGSSFRTVYMYPDEITRNISGQNTTLPGYFQAAAFGGYLGGQLDIARPPTFNTLGGFNVPNTKRLKKRVKNQLAGAGILVTEPVAGGARMLWGKTTTQSGAPEEEEVSIVSIRDQVARTVRASLRPFIGRVQSPTIIAEVNGAIAKLLRSLVGQGLLSGFGSITVQRNPIEPRQIDIGMVINPTGPINWIFVDLVAEL